MAHNPWIGEKQPVSWGSMLGLLRADAWIPHAELREAGTAGGMQKTSVDRLLYTARDYGVLARRGDYDGKKKKDWREYRLLPADWLNRNAAAWIDVPPDYRCPCSSPAVGRVRSKKTGNYTWICSTHLEANR